MQLKRAITMQSSSRAGANQLIRSRDESPSDAPIHIGMSSRQKHKRAVDTLRAIQNDSYKRSPTRDFEEREEFKSRRESERRVPTESLPSLAKRETRTREKTDTFLASSRAAIVEHEGGVPEEEEEGERTGRRSGRDEGTDAVPMYSEETVGDMRRSRVRRQIQSSTQDCRRVKYREDMETMFKMPPILGQHNVTPSSFIAEDETGMIKYETLPGLDLFNQDKI